MLVVCIKKSHFIFGVSLAELDNRILTHHIFKDSPITFEFNCNRGRDDFVSQKYNTEQMLDYGLQFPRILMSKGQCL